MSLVRRAFAAVEQRAAEFGDSTPPPPGSFSGDMAGAGISETSALQIMAVYGSVALIADSLAVLPWQRFSDEDAARRKKLPLTQLLKKPYVEIRRTDWLTQYATSMALRGNFYGHILERTEDFYPSQIKPVHPDRVTVRRLPGGQIEYTFGGRKVPTDDVFHVRNLTVAGGLQGLNPIEYLRVSFAKARAQDQFGAEFFKNSAFPGGVIKVEDDLDLDETVTLLRNWLAGHQGVGRAHLPAVLTGGAEFEAVTINPKDSQFLESQQYSESAISGRIFRVPPHMIGIVDKSTSWGTGIEQQETGFVTNTLGGYVGRLEEAVDECHPDPEYCRLDLSKRMRGDKLSRFKAHALGIGAGFLNPDDARAEEDMAPIPDGKGQTFLVPINSQTLDQALAEEDEPTQGKGAVDA